MNITENVKVCRAHKGWRVWFVLGCQGFSVGPKRDSKREAVLYGEVFAKALEASQENCEPVKRLRRDIKAMKILGREAQDSLDALKGFPITKSADSGRSAPGQ